MWTEKDVWFEMYKRTSERSQETCSLWSSVFLRSKISGSHILQCGKADSHACITDVLEVDDLDQAYIDQVEAVTDVVVKQLLHDVEVRDLARSGASESPS